MMGDALVGYPVAKLAKEKGFAQRFCEYGYTMDGQPSVDFALDYINNTGVGAPTQFLLQRWLRETHQLHVQVSPKQGHLLEWYVYVIGGKEVVAELKALFFTEYEAALERGIELALNLLPD